MTIRGIIVAVDCKRCGGSGQRPDYAQPLPGRPVTKHCRACSGTGHQARTISVEEARELLREET